MLDVHKFVDESYVHIIHCVHHCAPCVHNFSESVLA